MILADHGIEVSNVALNLERMQARKQRVVRELTQGIEQLFKANGVTWVQGRGQLLAGKQVQVTDREGGTQALVAENVILAPGSTPLLIEQVPLHEDVVVDSTGALAFDAVPQRLGIIGAGVIGLELGSVWRRLGAESVILLEAMDQFLAMADEQVAREAKRLFTRQGLDIRLGSRVTGSRVGATGVEVTFQDAGGEHLVEFDKLIVAVGRRPKTEGIAADEATLLLDEWGLIHVDDQCRTNLPGVYAIGDAVRGPMLAHKGSEEGIAVAERIAGQSTEVRYDRIASVIYTQPEIAWVGKTEQELRAEGIAYRSGRFPFAYNGRALGRDEPEGFIKMLADEKTDRVLGVHALGGQASELIAEAVVAMEFGASSEDIARICHAHPSMSEVMREAALAVDKRSLNG